MKQASDQYYWYEAVNKDGEKYYWNETTMTVTKRKPKGLLLPIQVSKPVHSHKRSDNDHIKSCRFFELGRCKFGNRCWYSHKKEFPPRSENRPQSKNPSNYSQNSRNWESKSDIRNKSNQNAIPRQNYSFDNGNNSDIVCGNPFLGQMCQQIQNMSLMLDKKLKEITGLFQTQTQTHIPQQISYMIPSPQPTPLQTVVNPQNATIFPPNPNQLTQS